MYIGVRDVLRAPKAFGPTGVPMLTRWGGVSHTEAVFETDFDTLAKLMPENIELATNKVHVYQNTYKKYSHNGGRAYNYFGIGIDAIFNNKDGSKAPGWYLPICWMNDPISIIAGRDSSVVFPKLYGEILDPIETRDGLYCSVAEYGTKMIEIEVTNLQKAPEDVRKQIQKNGFKGTWLLDGGPLPAYNRYDAIYYGESKIKFNEVTWEECPSAYYVINYLRKLPMLRMGMSQHWEGCIEMSDLGELGDAERKGLLP